ncbi:flagellar hook-associated protein FlgK [Dongia mobilis]|uniref:Flagellar hook-associated protein 1 n=1 Tax=Dongia mobilis TaxID=578943 RepID=A0A4R6WVZ0_9PROT|nr:flagellar basal body rod C-terminal domain-containing protein [Dongia mobilis]TDQ84360.1 flagellar hook-associated protein FlgK [Dongia mobilis]
MSLTGALNAAISSLRVNQANIQVLSANIARANDPNYTKKSLSRESIYLGENQVGGVAIANYASAVNDSLRKQWESLIAKDGTTSAQNKYMQQLQQVLGTSTDQAGLPTLYTQFLTAWQNLQTSPDSDAAQQMVIQYGDQLADEVARIAGAVDAIDRDIKTDIEGSLEDFNGLLEKLFEVNLRLRSSQSGSAGQTELIDQRDALVRQISQYADVRTVERENGAIAVFTASGLSLIDGPPSRFTYDGVNIFRSDDPTQAVDLLFRDGKLRALLDLRLDNSAKGLPASSDPATEIIRKMRSQLDAVVSVMTTTIGQSTTFSAAYDGAGSSLRIEASFQTTIAATPASAQHSTVFLAGDLRPGDIFEVEINGKIFSYTAQETDTSLDQIAAGLAARINTDTTLGVTAINGVASLQIVANASDVPFSILSRANGELPELRSSFFTGTDRYTFQVNQALLDGTQQLKKNAANDVVNALNATDRTFTAAGIALSGVSYKGIFTGMVGTSLLGAKFILDQSKFNAESVTQTEQRYQADVAVNLDEEIANLQVLQNAYAASARLMTVVQQLFDTLQAAVR